MIGAEESTASNEAQAGQTTASPADIAQKSVEKLVEMQKLMIDMAVQQNAVAMKVVKDALGMVGAAPAAAVVDLARQGVEAFLGAQKGILDLATRQTAVAIGAVKEQGDMAASKVRSTVADAVKEVSERFLAGQKLVLDFAAKQNEIAVQAINQQAAGPGGQAFANSVRQGVDALVETQKQLIDLASKPLKVKTAKA